LFSGYLTNILAKDEKLLDILQPEYAMRLNGNITFYKNSFDRMNVSVKDEEILLNSLRKNHRLLKFQILFALINDEINIKRASNELSLLAQATFDISLKIIHAQISAKYKVENLKYSIIAYGRFATSTMTANSDLDLVFIYDDENGDEKASRKIYVELFRQIIKFLSVKTEEGLMYEVDTKLKPSGKGGPVACTYSNFKDYHLKKSYSWEKIALKKTKIINENDFKEKSIDLLNKLKSIPISQDKVANEISLMRTDKAPNNNEVKKETLKWFETKYAGGGQRDIEFLDFFNENNSISISQEEKAKKFMLINRMKSLFFNLDQIMNICFEDNKQEHLPSNAVNILIKETNEKDLGSLKATVKLGRKEIYKFLNEVVEFLKIARPNKKN
jgi:glutamate-ammonia-ligase adenylyltransferase